MSRRYISSEGQIVRANRVQFSTPRLSLAILAVAALYVTNPANEANESLRELKSIFYGDHGWPRERGSNEAFSTDGTRKRTQQGRRGPPHRERTYLGSISYELFGIELDLFRSTTDSTLWNAAWKTSTDMTNFVLFSLRRSTDGVTAHAIGKQIKICSFYNDREGWPCELIADTLCHRMTMFDRHNKPFTAHRFFEIALIASAVLSTCAKNDSSLGLYASTTDLRENPFRIFLSVFHLPELLSDLILLNVAVYPALVSMDRLVTLGSLGKTDDVSWRFFFSSFALVCIVGGTANLAGSMVVNRPVSGMKGAAAAALGYLIAIAPSKFILSFMGMRLMAGEVLLGVAIGAFLSLFSKNLCLLHWDSGLAFSWVFGGMAGNAMGRLQFDQFGRWWFPSY